jgi:hypothetical protein
MNLPDPLLLKILNADQKIGEKLERWKVGED